jgi:hypothetical protein
VSLVLQKVAEVLHSTHSPTHTTKKKTQLRAPRSILLVLTLSSGGGDRAGDAGLSHD